MKPRRVRYVENFNRSLQALPSDIQQQVIEAITSFINRSAENAVRPERKSGLGGVWAFRVTSGVRVFYVQGKDQQGTYSELFHVGPHDNYRTIERRRPRRR
jgi:hypothetical protein